MVKDRWYLAFPAAESVPIYFRQYFSNASMRSGFSPQGAPEALSKYQALLGGQPFDLA
jgi:hypothetical protein